ncbi:hypothetical protein QTP88_029392 [Uroleucon formosanum]
MTHQPGQDWLNRLASIDKSSSTWWNLSCRSKKLTNARSSPAPERSTRSKRVKDRQACRSGPSPATNGADRIDKMEDAFERLAIEKNVGGATDHVTPSTHRGTTGGDRPYRRVEHQNGRARAADYGRPEKATGRPLNGKPLQIDKLPVKLCKQCNHERGCKSVNTGKGFVNSLINSLPFEAHIPGYQYCGPGTKLKKRLDRGDKGINQLDSACRDHDIVYATSKNLDDRHKADKVLENRAWERYLFKDTLRKEKFVAYAVANAMKAKRKLGMGCKRKRSIKTNGILAAKKKRNLKKKNGGKRLILEPRQSGGVIPLIPIFAGLLTLGSLMSGGASVYNAVQNAKRKKNNDIIKNVGKLKINHFRGVFSRDNLPKKPHAIECGILNLVISSGVGSHWVAFHNNKDKVVYFDSFGDLPPPIESQHYFKQFKIVYNYSNYQDFNTFNCGHLCLEFLQCMNLLH